LADLYVVAVDGSPAGEGALVLAGKQAIATGARIVVLCTIDAAYALKQHGDAIADEDQREYPAAAREEFAAAKIVRDALQILRVAGVESASEVLVGTPARAILDAADRLRADMIVMSHRHLSWFDRMLHPSVCWDVLEQAECPVLVSMTTDAHVKGVGDGNDHFPASTIR
jgi:nucleotide-binding universal stress UspA family protein